MSARAEFSKTQVMVYEMKVGEVMATDVIAVRPGDQMSTLREVLRHNRISGLPVAEGDRLVGLISLDDFIEWLAEREDECPIAQRMTQEVETVYSDEPLVLAIGKFEKSGLGRFPVMDRTSGRLVGIVTKGDVIRGLLKKLEIDYQEELVRHTKENRILQDIEADKATLFFQYNVVGQDFSKAGAGSSRLKKTLRRLGVQPDVVRRVAIATYEAEMNLVVFTQGGMIRARVEPDSISVEVRDAGPGIPDVEKALTPGYSTAPDWVRELGFGAGMGLPNIRKSADVFEIRSEPGKGTRVKAGFFLGEDTHETI